MPGLFWKLFGAFWLTTVLILAFSIYASFRLADHHNSNQQMIDPREADAMLRDIIDREGIAGLERWIADESSLPPGQTVYMIDENGRDFLEREVPQFLQHRSRRMWQRIHNAAVRGAGSRRPRREFFPLIQAEDGRPLLAMPGPAPISPFGILSSAGLRWTVLAVAMIVSLVSFWLLSRSMIRPALRISGTAKRLAAGDLSARVGEGGYSNDEIGQLGRQFDRMATELEAQAALRRELFRNVSHELRAPLARLQIAVELLDRKPEQAAKQIERVRQDLDVLENLTTQVLALARAEQADTGAEQASLRRVLDDVASDAAFEANARGVHLDWPGASETPSANPTETARGDFRVATSASMLRSAIENVVRNAIQVTPAGGRVRLDAEVSTALAVIRVADTGPGVPDAELERIFQPFFRIDTNRPGSGIGLAITARVIRQLGGSVEARNATGGGLVVTLSVPGATMTAAPGASPAYKPTPPEP